jgi:ribonuclease HI
MINKTHVFFFLLQMQYWTKTRLHRLKTSILYLNYTSKIIAELWGVYNGLCLAKQNGLNNIELQIDSMTVVKTLSGDRLDNNGGRSLVRCIRRLFQEEWNIKIRHACVREAN